MTHPLMKILDRVNSTVYCLVEEALEEAIETAEEHGLDTEELEEALESLSLGNHDEALHALVNLCQEVQ